MGGDERQVILVTRNVHVMKNALGGEVWGEQGGMQGGEV